MTRRRADTIIGGIIAILIMQLLCTAVVLRRQELDRIRTAPAGAEVHEGNPVPEWFTPPTAETLRAERRAATISDISNFMSALEMYRYDTGHYPSTRVGLSVLVRNVDGESDWKGPYLHAITEICQDPWGSEYTYTAPGRYGHPYLISSAGDGQPITSEQKEAR